MATDRCWHEAVMAATDTQLRDALPVQADVNVVVTCATCGTPCRVWLYYDEATTPVLLVKEDVPGGAMDYYRWTGTEWWED